MKLLALEIRHLPGIEAPFSVAMDPQTANLITGPNGSGKSSLVRAVRAVLYPQAEDGYCELVLRWQDGNGELIAERVGDQVSWIRSGKRTAAPRLPEAASIDAFLVSTEDLSAPGRTDAHIAAELKTLLTGGYDLDALLTAAPLASPPRPQKLAREVERLHRDIDDKEREYTQLHDELDRLSALEDQLGQATEAAARIQAVTDALALAEAAARRSALEATLIEEFPGGMDRLRGDELERLDDCQRQLESRQQAIVQEHTALKAEQARLDETGVDDPEALEGLQAELADARDLLAACEQRIESESDQLDQAEQMAAEAAARLGGDPPARLEQLDQAALEQLEKQVDKVLGLRERIRALGGQLGLTQASRNLTGRPRDDLRNARSALQDWLALARLSPLEGWLWGILALAALIGGARLLAAAELARQPELLLLVALAVGLPVAMLVRFGLRLRDRGQARRDFEASAIEPPLGWNEPEVRARLKRLDLELEAATQHEISQLRAGDLRQELNIQRAALDRARQQLGELAAGLGLSAEHRLETTFLLWSRHLQDWQQAQARSARHGQRLKQLKVRYQAECQQASKLLERHGVAVDELSSRALAGLVNQLIPKIRRHAELFNSIQARNRRISELHADITQLRQRLHAIFEAAGMRPEDDIGLRHKAEQLPLWQKLEGERIELGREIARLEQRLSEEPDLLKMARRQQHQALTSLHESLHESAAQRDLLNRRIAEIQTRHADALQRRELARLVGEIEAGKNALELELERHLLAAAGRFLVEDVAATHRAEQAPALLAAADHWLNRFTGHRYRLEFSANEFRARDTRSGQLQPATRLSTGTRAQLMLAVRLAWIEQLEARFEPLPLFMDEALTTSDADRYRAIVEAVGQLVAGGRQVFYITAQSDDAQAWRDWLGQGLVPHEIDMARLRQDQVEQLEFRLPEGPSAPPSIPDPDCARPDKWAREVGVDAIDPWRDAGLISVFHLLRDDLGLAAGLMRAGLHQLGPLERFVELVRTSPDAAPDWLDAEQARLLGGRIRAARMLMEHWRSTHARPVDRATLIRTGLISDRFLPRVARLAEEVGGDPHALIHALGEGQVARFRSDTLGQLESWLARHGFLSANAAHDRLTGAEIALACDLPPDLANALLEWLEAAIRDPLAPGR
ncbi:MAG: ATP-binding protein [Wenzhouxiangella sp.]